MSAPLPPKRPKLMCAMPTHCPADDCPDCDPCHADVVLELANA